ncbi:hypothetical protein INR49_002850 [Caranx melampygus]|nr:hypothetical protein INR49_002850 [Caranx melampygus]
MLHATSEGVGSERASGVEEKKNWWRKGTSENDILGLELQQDAVQESQRSPLMSRQTWSG